MGAISRMDSVGRSAKRKDGTGNATGRTKYADDLVVPGQAHAAFVRAGIDR